MQTEAKMKPEMFRLVSLDIIVASACAIVILKGVTPEMFWPTFIAQLTVLSYSLYLLAHKLGKNAHES